MKQLNEPDKLTNKKCGVSTLNTDENKMRKILILFSTVALLALVSCSKDKTATTGLDKKALVNEIFKASMSGYSNTNALKSTQTLKSTIPLNESVDVTVQGPQGGSIHVTGTLTGSMSFNDQTSSILGGTMLLGFTETINDYAFMSNGQKYTMNGAPYVSLAGTFTIESGGTFGTASSFDIGGGIKVTGPDYDETININITIIINSSGKGGRVSGTIGGESINYSL